MDLREIPKIKMIRRFDDIEKGTVLELFQDGVFTRAKTGKKQKSQKWIQVALSSNRAKPYVKCYALV